VQKLATNQKGKVVFGQVGGGGVDPTTVL